MAFKSQIHTIDEDRGMIFGFKIEIEPPASSTRTQDEARRRKREDLCRHLGLIESGRRR